MKRRLDAESGASLIMVIIFVTIFGLITAALLDFASTGFETTKSVADVRNDQHALDGAMEGAINAIRRSSSAGFDGYCPPFEYAGSSDNPEDPDVTVVCTPRASSTAGGVDDRFPKFAVLLLGEAADEGYLQSQMETVTVDGGIWSNSRVEVTQTNAVLRSLGDLFAVGPCDGGAGAIEVIGGAFDCAVTAMGPGHADYPAYPTAVGDTSDLVGNIDLLADVDPVAACTGGGVVKFSPGLYSEHPAAFADEAGCSGDVWWFQPGAYYFDYAADVPLNDADGSPGGTGATVIGGTRSSTWNDATSASAIAVPGACDAGTLEVPNPGVQFILGAQATLEAKNDAGIELCAGEFPNTGQRIVVYGLPQGYSRTPVASPGTPEAHEALTQSTGGTPASATFTNIGSARAIDGVSEAAELKRGEQGTVTLDDFFDAIPEGATLTSAKLRLTNSIPSARINWYLDVDDGDTDTALITFGSGDLTGGAIDLLDAPSLREAFRWRQIRDLSVTYRAVWDGGGPPASPPQTTTLDGIELDVSYVLPGFESPTCFRDSDCPLITSDTNPISVFDGTVYAPDQWLDVRIHNSGRTAFRRGIIAWALKGTMNESSTQTDAPFQRGGEVETRTVLLEAQIGGTTKLRAVVTFDDSDLVPGREVTIEDWAYVR